MRCSLSCSDNPTQISRIRSCISALKACGGSKDLEQGKRVHKHAIESGYGWNLYVANTALDMFAKCGSLPDARSVFDRMPRHTVASWNSMLRGYAETPDREEAALELFGLMPAQPEPRTFVAVLKACTNLAERERCVVKLEALARGMAVHSQAERLNVCNGSCIFLANSLVDFYAKCGSLIDSRRVFDGMLQHDVVSWNSLLLGYAVNGEEVLALQLFSEMMQQGCRPNALTFVAALKASTGLAIREDGKLVDGSFIKIESRDRGLEIHSQAKRFDCECDVKVAGSLVDMYSKCGCMVDARRVFESVFHHRDVVLWNVLILGYAENKECELSLECFDALGCVRPNSWTFVAALKACGWLAVKEEGRDVRGKIFKLGALEKGMALHGKAAVAGCESDIYVSSTLVDMYAKCGSLVDARQVFDKMHHRNAVAWNALILGCVENGEAGHAVELVEVMDSEPDRLFFISALKAFGALGVADHNRREFALEKGREFHRQRRWEYSDACVASALVEMYTKCGSLVDARKVLETTPSVDLASKNLLMLGYVESGNGKLALEIYNTLGSTRDTLTFVAALKACSSLVFVEAGKEIHADITRCGLEGDPVLATCLVDFYAKCGSMENAQIAFHSAHSRDSVSVTALIVGYSQKGDVCNVFRYFHAMEDERLALSGVTLLGLLTACSHAGVVEAGRRYFEAMKMGKYGVAPELEHYASMVDLLARANHLDEALAVVMSMPLQPNAVVWTSLLAGCSKWKNVEIGRIAFEALSRMDEAAHSSA